MGPTEPTGERIAAGATLSAGPASWRDLPAIGRLYRAQSTESRRFYHPFPFDRLRLIGLLAGVVVLQSARHRTVRHLPALAPLLWVVRESPGRRVLGFGTGTFHRDDTGRLVVRTGLYVAPDARRRGVGRLLKQSLVREGARLGARRAEALLVEANQASWELNRSLGARFRPSDFRDPRVPSADQRVAELDLDPPEGAAPVSAGTRTIGDAGTPAATVRS